MNTQRKLAMTAMVGMALFATLVVPANAQLSQKSVTIDIQGDQVSSTNRVGCAVQYMDGEGAYHQTEQVVSTSSLTIPYDMDSQYVSVFCVDDLGHFGDANLSDSPSQEITVQVPRL